MFPSSVWIFLIITSSCKGLSQGSEIDVVKLLYHRQTIEAFAGSNIQLKCVANYSLDGCGWVHVAWHRVLLKWVQPEESHSIEPEEPQRVPLEEPSKYLTIVSETIDHDSWRLRSVVTKIFSVTRNDSGIYQCLSYCEENNTASGHMITVAVHSGSGV
ncbi:uncharacterized protein ACB058_020047 [Synchiropus picturatus]